MGELKVILENDEALLSYIYSSSISYPTEQGLVWLGKLNSCTVMPIMPKGYTKLSVVFLDECMWLVFTTCLYVH